MPPGFIPFDPYSFNDFDPLGCILQTAAIFPPPNPIFAGVMKGKSRAMKDQIRRMFEDGDKIKKISSALGISKNTVKKYLREDVAKYSPDSLVAKVDQGQGIDWDYAIGQLAIGCPPEDCI
jgi:hypothetical protein